MRRSTFGINYQVAHTGARVSNNRKMQRIVSEAALDEASFGRARIYQFVMQCFLTMYAQCLPLNVLRYFYVEVSILKIAF